MVIQRTIIANYYTPFTANANVDRNILIEDFTGHTCNFCPAEAEEAKFISDANSGRVFVSSVHAGPNGTGTFQELNPGSGYNTVFYNETTDELGNYFGVQWVGTVFWGNPFGTISRNSDETGTPTQSPQDWDNSTDPNYVHHDILRGTLDNKTFGQELDSIHKDPTNEKYNFNYVYELPLEYAADNAHLLIYIRDAVTEEIYHVIEQHID